MRRRRKLDGAWRWVIDQHEMVARDCRGFVEETNSAFPDIAEPPDWRTMRVPSNWNIGVPELRYYDGAVLFEREFAASRPGRRLFLRFEGSFYHTRVWLNGKRLGAHDGGFTPFEFDVTEYVRNGRNRLSAWVDAKPRAERLPCEMTDWFNYGGIYRSVFLEERAANHIADFFCRYDDGRIRVRIETAGAPRGVARLRVPELKIEREVRIHNRRGRADIPCEPTLWTPDAPKLYRVECAYGGDVVAERVGFRTIEARDGGILLNGSPIKLKGVCLHEEAAERGRALTKQDRAHAFDVAEELGLNFIRLAHYPHAREMALEADRRGFLLWEEIPVYWRIQFTNPDTYADAANQLAELIRRDRNRCSVAMWSVANETPVRSENRTRFLSDLADLARRLDPSRPVCAALVKAKEGDRIVIDDPLADKLDVLGLNHYGGWYGAGGADDLLRFDNSRFADKPVIVSEFGAGAKKGLHGRRRFSEEYQRALYKHTLAAIRKNPWIQGCTPWILFDFRTPNRINRFQNGWNRKGLVDADRHRRKLAFHTYKKWSF